MHNSAANYVKGKWAFYLCNIFSRNDAKLVGILVVLDHVGQQGHHVHGEGQTLGRVHHGEVQEQGEA